MTTTTMAGEMSQFGVDFVAVDKSLKRRFSIIGGVKECAYNTVWLPKKVRLSK